MNSENNKQNEKTGQENPPDKDSSMSPETLTLLDEEFWREATPQKVQELISRGADINAKNKNGLTAAHYAAMHGDISILKVLGENGADMNIANNKAETPAHIVAQNEHSNDLLKELAKYGSDFNQKNISGESPKDLIRKNQPDAENLLVEIDAIQQKKGNELDEETEVRDTLQQGSQEGKDDPRNETKDLSDEDEKKQTSKKGKTSSANSTRGNYSR